MKTRHLEKTMKSGLNKNDNQKKGRKYRKQANEEINDYYDRNVFLLNSLIIRTINKLARKTVGKKNVL